MTEITKDTVRKVRKVYRLTLEDMAAIIGISTSYVWRIEHGERPLTANITAKFREEFELTTEKLARLTEIYEETCIT